MPAVRGHGAQGGCSSMATTSEQQKLDCNPDTYTGAFQKNKHFPRQFKLPLKFQM